MEGRQVGTAGGAKARAFVIERFKASGVVPLGESYEQPFTFTAGRGTAQAERQGVNVIGNIDGTTSPKQLHRRSAPTTTTSACATARCSTAPTTTRPGPPGCLPSRSIFSTHKPANTLIFAAFDAEESGLRGSRAFVPSLPVDAAAIGDRPQHGHDRPRSQRPAVCRRHVHAAVSEAVHRTHRGEGAREARDGPRRPGEGQQQHGTNQQFEDWTSRIPITSRSATRRFRACISASRISISIIEPTDDYETMTYGFYVRAVETMVLCRAGIRRADRRDVLKARGPREPRP